MSFFQGPPDTEKATSIAKMLARQYVESWMHRIKHPETCPRAFEGSYHKFFERKIFGHSPDIEPIMPNNIRKYLR